MVGSTKKGFNFAQSNLLSRGVVLRQLWTPRKLKCLGVDLASTLMYEVYGEFWALSC
jgi:hypothetical protein